MIGVLGPEGTSQGLGKPRKVDSPKKKKVEKPQDGRQKSGQNIGNPYQMEDNKAAPSAPPKGAALRAAPLGFLLSSIWSGFPMFWSDF